MSRVLVDTSTFLALLVSTDAAHPRATWVFADLRTREASLLTTSYVLVETYVLLGRRFGQDAVRAFRERFAPLADVVWVNEGVHEQGLDVLLDRGRRG